MSTEILPLVRCDRHEWMGRGPCPYCEAWAEPMPVLVQPGGPGLDEYGPVSSMDEATLFRAYRNARPQGRIDHTSDG